MEAATYLIAPVLALSCDDLSLLVRMTLGATFHAVGSRRLVELLRTILRRALQASKVRHVSQETCWVTHRKALHHINGQGLGCESEMGRGEITLGFSYAYRRACITVTN